MISKKLIQTIAQQNKQSLKGIHGLSHWARVLENGNRLAQFTGAKVEVVELFAVFHDSMRINDGIDHKHGLRGAEFAASLKSVLNLSGDDFNLLFNACVSHTDGFTEADITVQTCWDADRLDLGRIGVKPDPQKLCTSAAKKPDIIAWANKRSREYFIPDFVFHEWNNVLSE